MWIGGRDDACVVRIDGNASLMSGASKNPETVLDTKMETAIAMPGMVADATNTGDTCVAPTRKPA